MTWAPFSQSGAFTLSLFPPAIGVSLSLRQGRKGKNALSPLPIKAQDPAISINRAFALLHTKLARISDSSIPHMHAFTCRCRHLSLSASPSLV